MRYLGYPGSLFFFATSDRKTNIWGFPPSFLFFSCLRGFKDKHFRFKLSFTSPPVTPTRRPAPPSGQDGCPPKHKSEMCPTAPPFFLIFSPRELVSYPPRDRLNLVYFKSKPPSCWGKGFLSMCVTTHRNLSLLRLFL